MVAFRNQIAIEESPAVWKGRRLLERTDLDSDELPCAGSSLQRESKILSLRTIDYANIASVEQKYAKEPGPHQTLAGEIYSELRTNIIDNVYKVGHERSSAPDYNTNERAMIPSGIRKNGIRLGTVQRKYWRRSKKVSLCFSCA